MASTSRPAPVLILLLFLISRPASGSAPLLLLPSAAATRSAPLCPFLVLLFSMLILQFLHIVKEPIFPIVRLVHSYKSWILGDKFFEVAPVRVVVNAFCLLQKFLEAFLCCFSLFIFLLLLFLLQF